MKKNSIVYIEYETRIKENNKMIDTTNEEVAKKENIYNDKKRYGKIPIIIGVGDFIKGFENALLNAEVGNEYNIEIPPSEGYGERDNSRIEVYSIKKFEQQKVMPELGKEIVIKNHIGTITNISCGRVRVDFNSKYAGKTLKYKYKIISEITDNLERINALIDYHYRNSKDFKISLGNKQATITIPDECKHDSRWFSTKTILGKAIIEILDFDKLSFIEEHQPKVIEKSELLRPNIAMLRS